MTILCGVTPDADFDEAYSYTLHMSGQASTLPVDEADAVIDALHAIVKEVTGKAVEKSAPRRIGFV